MEAVRLLGYGPMSQYQQPPYGPPPAPGQSIPAAFAPAVDVPMTPGPSSAPAFGAIAAVKKVFEDPDWKSNVMIGLVLLLIPIVGPIALSGWMCEVHQRLVRRHPKPVVKIDFSDFAEYLKRGVYVFLVQLILSLPLSFLIMALAFGAGFGAFAASSSGMDPAIMIGLGVVVGLVFFAFMVLFNVLTNAATTRAELTENLGEALKFGELMAYSKATFGKVVVKTITFGFVSLGIALLGLALCYLGIYPAAIVLQIAAMHLRHMIYEDYLARGGAPIPIKAAVPLPSEQQRLQHAWTGY